MLILVICSATFTVSKAQVAYPCDLASTGVELWNTAGTTQIGTIPVNGTAKMRLRVLNAGSASGTCSYAVGQVLVHVNFVPSTSSSSYFYKYDGPPTFASSKYTWTYDTFSDILEGVNTVPIVAGFSGFETVDIPIKGVSPGFYLLGFQGEIFASASGDDVNNNYWTVPVTVISATGGPLPLTIKTQEGKSENCSAIAKWTTSNETNVAKFEIQTSNDGVNFVSIGTVNGVNLATENNYQYTWKQEGGKIYYRLKVIDKDGSFTFSKVVPIIIDCKSNKFVTVFPNPIIENQLLTVNLTGYDASVKGSLYSSTGQLVQSFVLKNGKNTIGIEKIAQGFYTLRVSENGIQTEVVKINVLK